MSHGQTVGVGDRVFEVHECPGMADVTAGSWAGGVVVKQYIPATMVDWFNRETGVYEKYERLGHWRVLKPGRLREQVIASVRARPKAETI